MAFIIDRQTINDLNIFGKVRGNSVYGVFNSTRTEEAHNCWKRCSIILSLMRKE